MTTFAKGDKVYWNGATHIPIGTIGIVSEIYDTHMIVEVGGKAGNHFCWRWSKVEEEKTKTVKTGGSTPNQYRLSVNLPLTSDRTQFVDVDLEAMDVSDALDLSGNLRDVQKALFRMGKKDGVSESYDFNKQLFCTLREMKKRGIISHAKFWEATQALENVLNET